MSSIDWSEAQGRWKGLFTVALKKVQKQFHPHLDLDDDATEYLDKIMYSLLVHICAQQDEVPMSDVECEQCVTKLFPSDSAVLMRWCTTSASDAVKKFTDNRSRMTTKLSEFPVEKAHSRLMKDGSKGKSIKIELVVSVYLMSVLDYVAADVLKLVGEYATRVDTNASRVCLRDINTAVKGDNALDALLQPLTKLPMQRAVAGIQAGIASNLSYEATIKEIMLAESAYQVKLDMLTKVFLDLFESIPNVSEQDRENIFGNIKTIVELTQGLTGLLEECISLAESRSDLNFPPFGQCLLVFIVDGEMDAYKDYAEGFEVSRATLKDVIPNITSSLSPDMQLAVEHILPDLLAEPILHMRHYYEVLRLLCNVTPPDEADVGRLKQAMSALQNIRRSVSSDRIKVFSRYQSYALFQQTAAKLQANIGDWHGPEIDTVAKSLTASASDVIIWHEKAGKMAQRIAWSFDNLVIFCKTADKKGYQYRLKERFDLRAVDVTKIQQADGGEFEFALKISDPNSGEQLILVTDSAVSNHNWYLTLKQPKITKFLDQSLERKEEEYEKGLPDLMPDKSVYPFSERDAANNIKIDRSSGTDVVKGGTLAKLIERLTYPKHADMNYVKDFLISFRSFSTPHSLMDHLISRYRIPEPDISDKAKLRLFNRKIAIPVKLRVVNVFKQWIDKHYDDYIDDPKLLKKLLQFIKMDLSTNLSMKSKVALLTKSVRRQRDLITNKDVSKTNDPAPPVLWPQHINSETINFFHVMTLHPIELARQLTRIESETYRAIKASELAGQAWSKGTRQSQYERAPQVLKMIHRFNQVSQWVTRTVVEMKNFEERVDTVGIFLEILRELLVLQNFNGAMEILSGLQRSTVQRLNFTWAEVSSKKIKVLKECEELVSSDKNYLKLRTKISQLNPPCIPFFGMYLSDITFVEEGSSDFLPNADGSSADQLINFGKRRLGAKCIHQIQQYQNECYNLQDNADMRRFLLDFPALNDNQDLQLPHPEATPVETEAFVDTLYNTSLELEPRGFEDKSELEQHPPIFPDAAKKRRAMLVELEKYKDTSAGMRQRGASTSGSHRSLSTTSTSSLQSTRSYSTSINDGLTRSDSSASQMQRVRRISELNTSRRTSGSLTGQNESAPSLPPRRSLSRSMSTPDGGDIPPPRPLSRSPSTDSGTPPPPRPPRRTNSMSASSPLGGPPVSDNVPPLVPPRH